MKKITVITITVFTSILLLALTYSLLIHKEGDPSADIIINIEHGDTLNQIKKKLMSEELIGSGVLFEFHVRLWRVGTKIKAGEYSLNRSYSISKIVEIITDGKSLLHKLTVPEGSSIKDIANLLDASPIKGGDDFIEFALSLERGSEYNFLKGVSLEGYLYPETYYFTRNATSKVVAEIMVKTFIEKVSSAIDDTIFNDKNRLHEIITLASIIEKESSIDSERKLVSSVFHNRLKKGMLLQSDPTVIYGLPEFDGNIRKKDLSYDSPYNSYLYKGLPPGPIANPSIQSIEAALYPAESDYLYFVSKEAMKDHYFSKSYAEHLEAVKKYQLRKK